MDGDGSEAAFYSADSALTDLISRAVIWVGSSKDDISALLGAVKASFGFRLRQVQNGKTPSDMKPLPQFGNGVFELSERFEKNAFRLMYVVNLKNAIYVLHAFKKKSKSGIKTPRHELATIETRLKWAELDYQRWVKDQVA